MIQSNAVDQEVRADDGVRLHARIEGLPDAPVTVVLCHGFGMTSVSWCFQRAALAATARVVSWDQRGHGFSGYGSPGSVSIDQLARDLRAVLDQCVPDGPVVLAGHSTGGMTIMALAAAHPELFGPRVVGVVLVGTSAGPVEAPSLGGLASALACRAAMRAAATLEPALGLMRRLPGNGPLLRELIRRVGSAVPAAVLDSVVEMVLGSPVKVIADLLPGFQTHDKLLALDPLRRVSTLVLVGERDLITPPALARAIVARLPGADLVVVPNTGHLVMLERPILVNDWLHAMVTPAWERG